MKKEIHPKYYPKAKIICACGAVYKVGSTVPETHIEICAQCHPFYTGKQKFVDIGGRVERYKKMVEKSKAAKGKRKKPKKVTGAKKNRGKKK